MDTEDHRSYDRGGRGRGRGYNRGRNRYRNPRNYHNSNSYHYNQEYNDQNSSQKDESGNYEHDSGSFRPRGRGQRGFRRGQRGVPRIARGGRYRRGGHHYAQQNDHPIQDQNTTQQEEGDEFGFNPNKNYGYGKPSRGGRGQRGQRGGRQHGGQQRYNQAQASGKPTNPPPPPMGNFKRIDDRPQTAAPFQSMPGGPPINFMPDEETKVYYQAEDFLVKYDSLPEKTEYLVKSLCEGTLS